MPIDPKSNSPTPGPLTLSTWEREQAALGPGLQQAVLWSRLAIARGENAFLFDEDGRRYIDFFGASGVNSIGHAHLRYVEAMSRQMSQWMVGGFASQARAEMLERLIEVLPRELDRVQLYTTGSEAVEAALRLAKSYTKRYEFLGFWNGFHGKTLGSLGLTDGEKRALGPVAPGFHATPYADCRNCALRLEFPACNFACVDFARETLERVGAGALAGIVVEPLQGRAGNIVPPVGYLGALRELAHQNGALLVVDETLSGFGRTGRMFCFEYDDVVPDILIVGKGMGGGYPVTAVISSSKIMSAPPYSNPSASSSSYGGFPLACRAVATTLEIYRDERLVQRSAELGAELLERLTPLQGTLPLVRSVQGRGLMIGLRLWDPEKRAALARETLGLVYQELVARGLLVMVSSSSIRLYPPLTVPRDAVIQAAEILEDVLRERSRALGWG